MRTDRSDEQLVQEIAAGERAAFDLLVERHGDALFRFAARTCASERDAEDAVQDALLAVWRGAGTFRGDAPARTWIYRVVLHACRRRSRRRSGEPYVQAPIDAAADHPHEVASAEDRLAAREVGAALAKAMEELAPEEREILLLRDVEALSGTETADVLGLGLAAMKSRLHRARLALKQRVEELLGHPIEELVP